MAAVPELELDVPTAHLLGEAVVLGQAHLRALGLSSLLPLAGPAIQLAIEIALASTGVGHIVVAAKEVAIVHGIAETPLVFCQDAFSIFEGEAPLLASAFLHLQLLELGFQSFAICSGQLCTLGVLDHALLEGADPLLPEQRPQLSAPTFHSSDAITKNLRELDIHLVQLEEKPFVKAVLAAPLPGARIAAALASGPLVEPSLIDAERGEKVASLVVKLAPTTSSLSMLLQSGGVQTHSGGQNDCTALHLEDQGQQQHLPNANIQRQSREHAP